MKLGILTHYQHSLDRSLEQITATCLNKGIEVEVINPLNINLATGFSPNVAFGFPKVDAIITRCDIDSICTVEAEAYFKAMTYYEALNIPIINNEQAIRISQDKMLTHQMLTVQGVATPKSFLSNSLDSCIEVAKSHFGYPLIGKAIYGGRGEDVVKILNESELVSFYKKLHAENKTIFIQEFVKTERTEVGGYKSYRTIVGRNEDNAPVVFACYEKQSVPPDFRTSMLCGATANRLKEADEGILDISRKALDALQADLTAIDLLKDNEGNIYVLESNICFYCIDEMVDFIGTNIWDSIVDYQLKSFEKLKLVTEVV